MKIETRRFWPIIKNFRKEDQRLTMETVEKFGFDQDVVVTLDNGDEIITSNYQATLMRFKGKE